VYCLEWPGAAGHGKIPSMQIHLLRNTTHACKKVLPVNKPTML
jgi:hypothetical protein